MVHKISCLTSYRSTDYEPTVISIKIAKRKKQKKEVNRNSFWKPHAIENPMIFVGAYRNYKTQVLEN